MSKLDSIKQQFPELNISIIDVLARLDSSKTYKYLPMFCKMMREHRSDQRWHGDEKKDMLYSLEKKNINTTNEEKIDWKYILALYAVSENIPRDLFDGGKDFIEYMERGLIDNKDVLTYRTMEDMRGALAIASLKAQSKELEKQVAKVYEDDEWVVVRPLTFEASAKYGAGTKWCTTYTQEKQYFARYWKRGILAYFINKTNGHKWGMFKNLDSNYEEELSWWNVTDKRVDFLEINFNEKMYGVVKKLLQSREANKYLCDEELQTKVLMECDPDELRKALFNNNPITESQLYTTYVDREVPLPEPVNEIEYDAAIRAVRDPSLETMAENFHRSLEQDLIEQMLRENGTVVTNGAQIPPLHVLSDIADEVQLERLVRERLQVNNGG